MYMAICQFRPSHRSNKCICVYIYIYLYIYMNMATSQQICAPDRIPGKLSNSPIFESGE